MISALEENLLRAVRDCTNAKAAWQKLHERYACVSMVNKLSVLNKHLNSKYKPSEDMDNYFSMLGS